jgi:hypothetical protein
MNRIILGMAITNYILVAATMVLGLMGDSPRDFNDLGNAAFRYHFQMGILTALFTMLVHCFVFTYFLGTSRWVKETVSAYRLDSSFLRQSQRMRGQAMGVAMISILAVVATIASGAGVHTRVFPISVHQLTPILTYTFMIFAYRIEIVSVERHVHLTDEIMEEVQRLRAERMPAALSS